MCYEFFHQILWTIITKLTEFIDWFLHHENIPAYCYPVCEFLASWGGGTPTHTPSLITRFSAMWILLSQNSKWHYTVRFNDINIIQAESQEALLRHKQHASKNASNGIITDLIPCVRSPMEIILKRTTMIRRYTLLLQRNKFHLNINWSHHIHELHLPQFSEGLALFLWQSFLNWSSMYCLR